MQPQKLEGAVIRQSKCVSEDNNSVTITYTVQDSADGSQRLRYSNTLTVISSLPETEEFPVDGQPPLIMKGGRRLGVLTENGHEISRGQIPPAHMPLSDARFTLTRKTESVRPYLNGIDGTPDLYIRTWDYTYKFSDEITSLEQLPFLKDALDGTATK